MSAEAFILLAKQIPAAPYDTSHFVWQLRLKGIVYLLEIKIFNLIFRSSNLLVRHPKNSVAIKKDIIGIIAYSTPAKTFFLEDETMIQEVSSLFVAGSKVNKLQMFVSLVDEMTEQKV